MSIIEPPAGHMATSLIKVFLTNWFGEIILTKINFYTMTEVQQLARFICDKRYDDLSALAILQLKARILDSLGCAIGALRSEPIEKIRNLILFFSDQSHVQLIGNGKAAPDRAAFFNGALVRYLDFNDSYLAKGETCHPSDNLSAVLAGAEFADITGREFLTALAIAYQVQCRLSDEAPVRDKGFDHTTQGAFAVAAGVAKSLGLNEEQTAHALAISGTSNIAFRVTRTGALSHWKGLAYPNTAFIGTHATFLAKYGITGPLEIFEGNKGFKALSGPFAIDWQKENLDRVASTILKKYNAEIHSQSALEGALELKTEQGFNGNDVDRVDVEIFDVAYHIIGGGDEGDKLSVQTKEEADHSLRYMLAVALLDGQVLPAQYASERIVRSDVQNLLRRVHIAPNKAYSALFPKQMPCSIKITFKDQRTFSIYKKDYEGFFSHPFSKETLIKKFMFLTASFISQEIQEQFIETVDRLDHLRVKDLTKLFSFFTEELS